MKSWLVSLLAALLLLAVAVMAQPEPGGKPAEGRGDRQPAKPQREAVALTGTIKEIGQPKGEQAAQQPINFALESNGAITHIGLGPAAYCTKVGLTLKVGDIVTVNGWKQPRPEAAPREGGENRPEGKGDRPAAHPKPEVVMARDITIAGKTYQMRDEDGRPLWGEFEGRPVVTVEGTVKEYVIPEPPKRGENGKPAEGERPKARVMPTLVVTTKDGDVRVVGIQPMMLQQMKEKFGDAPKVRVIGWQIPAGEKGQQTQVMARSLTVGDKTVELRDENGRPVQPERPQGNKPKGDRPQGDKPKGDKPRGEGKG